MTHRQRVSPPGDAEATAPGTRLFLEDERCDRVTAQLWLGIGSREEARRGATHLVEHLLWADLTERAARDRTLAGARIVAATGIDWMMFDVEAPAGAEAAVLRLLDEVWLAPEWDDEQIRREVGVIRNESRILSERNRDTVRQIVGDDLDLVEAFTPVVWNTARRVARAPYLLAVAGFRFPRRLGRIPRNWTVLDLASRLRWDRLAQTLGILPKHNPEPAIVGDRRETEVAISLAPEAAREADRTGRFEMLRTHLVHPMLGLPKTFPPFGPLIDGFSVAVAPLSQSQVQVEWTARRRVGIDMETAGMAFLDVAEKFGADMAQADFDAIRALVDAQLDRLASAPQAFFRAFGQAVAFDGCGPAARFYAAAKVPDLDGYDTALDALRRSAAAAKEHGLVTWRSG